MITITDINTNSNSNPVVMEEAIMMTDDNFNGDTVVVGVFSSDNFTVKPVLAVAIKKQLLLQGRIICVIASC